MAGHKFSAATAPMVHVRRFMCDKVELVHGYFSCVLVMRFACPSTYLIQEKRARWTAKTKKIIKKVVN
jgi:hypothetical protein